MGANDHGNEGFNAREPTGGGYSDGNLEAPGDTNWHAVELAAGNISNGNASLGFKQDQSGVHYVAVASFGPDMPNRSRLPVGTYTARVSTAP